MRCRCCLACRDRPKDEDTREAQSASLCEGIWSALNCSVSSVIFVRIWILILNICSKSRKEVIKKQKSRNLTSLSLINRSIYLKHFEQYQTSILSLKLSEYAWISELKELTRWKVWISEVTSGSFGQLTYLGAWEFW